MYPCAHAHVATPTRALQAAHPFDVASAQADEADEAAREEREFFSGWGERRAGSSKQREEEERYAAAARVQKTKVEAEFSAFRSGVHASQEGEDYGDENQETAALKLLVDALITAKESPSSLTDDGGA